jgi:hypothetical protein
MARIVQAGMRNGIGDSSLGGVTGELTCLGDIEIHPDLPMNVLVSSRRDRGKSCNTIE